MTDGMTIQLEREARRHGRMEIACLLAEWTNEHAHELQPHLIEELVNLVLSANAERQPR